jgi:DNA polymerase V
MKQPRVLALIDCNNFFVSCERLFRPDLDGKPVVVLSSNDGCAVSRSNEAKAIGIPMAAPVFKYRDIMERHNVVKFSANFELYGNVSRRITALLTSITPRIEVYSVDESFLDLSQLPITDYEAWGREVRELILKWVGIPVSVGIAPTKTLAKLANLSAKKNPELGGVLSFVKSRENSIARLNLAKTRKYLEKMPVGDIWGIGWRLAPKMRAEGIGNALQMAHARPQRVQQLIGIQGRQLIAELNGTSCYPLTLEGRLPQSIASTRTFGEDTSDPYAIEAALATFVTTASFKLRRSQQMTKRITLFATTNKHKPGYASWWREIRLDQPTADPGVLISAASKAFHDFYNPHISYHRAGITLHDFVPDSQLQTDLLGTIDTTSHDKSKQRMQAFDAINQRYGKRTIRLTSELMAGQWKPKYQLRSPRYVSRWDELPRVGTSTQSP